MQSSRTTTMDKTLRQGLADGQSRAATVDSALGVLAAGQHGHGESRQRLHQTCSKVNQYVRVCVEMCPVTTRHEAGVASRESR